MANSSNIITDKTIVNLTPHEVIVLGEDRTTRLAVYPSMGNARATQEQTPIGVLQDGVPMFRMAFGEPVDLPDPEAGTIFIVSTITRDAAEAAGRSIDDLVIVANPVRDDEGRIIGCRGLAFKA